MNDTALAPQNQDPYALMERMDDQQIVAEMSGQLSAVAQKLYYSFNQAGKEVTGLSKKGIDECTRFLAQRGEYIREENLEWEKDPVEDGFVIFKATVSRYVVKDGKECRLDTVIGTKRQAVTFSGRVDQFWFEKGSQKALRNAKARLVPQVVQQELLSQMRGKPEYHAPKQPQPQSTSQPKKEPENGNGDRWDWNDMSTWENRRIPAEWMPQALQHRAITFRDGATSKEITFATSDGKVNTLRQFMAYAWPENKVHPRQKQAHDMLAAAYPSQPIEPEPPVPDPVPVDVPPTATTMQDREPGQDDEQRLGETEAANFTPAFDQAAYAQDVDEPPASVFPKSTEPADVPAKRGRKATAKA